MPHMKASVVINTYNRADYLPNAIISIACQTYGAIELIVVNGPSTDSTELVLDKLAGEGICFKRESCSTRNLSDSRNIGVAAASGDVVFFIDDDAVAHKDWITRLMRRYENPEVGGAGGFTYDHTGVNFQCRYTVCDRFGNAHFFDTLDPETLLRFPGEFYFPSLLGTNCSFRMAELRAIGGFDEVFAYMLDETDVCLRIFKRGKRIITEPDAFVFHKFAPSHSRTPERIPTSLLAPARSKVYYCLKHENFAGGTTLEVFKEIDRYKKDVEFANRWYLDHKKISPAHFSRISKELLDGIAEGIRLGMDPVIKSARSETLNRRPHSPNEFLGIRAFEGASVTNSEPLTIYFVSQGYPPADTSGIARWTYECARSLVAKGHEVHVITRSASKTNYVDFFEGVWLHAVIDLFEDDNAFVSPIPIPASIACRAGAVLRELRRSEKIWGVDVVSAPIWDIEGILCAAYLKAPVVVSLHTTYKLAAPFKAEWTSNHDYRLNHVNKVIAGEQWLLENSKAILANSNEIVVEINQMYGNILGRRSEAVSTVAHGLGDRVRPDAISVANKAKKVDKSLKILFVGRIEERKGADQLLAALSQIPHLLVNVEIVFAGKSPGLEDSYVKRVMGLAEKLGEICTQTSIQFLGYVSDADLEVHYATSDIFVAPSRFESFGLILIEAMRHGTPVVACDIGGMREVINDGVDGRLFAVDDTVHLSRILGELIINPSLRADLGTAGKAKYEEKFTASVMAGNLEEFFRNVIKGQCDA
jgi:glycogen synthase